MMFSSGQVGCGAGNTVFPLVAIHPELFVHVCDFLPHVIAIVKSHVDFNEDQVNAFLCDVVNDDLCDTMMPSSIDVVTLPDGHILLREYAIGDYAQIVELDKRNQMIIENFYVRGDGTNLSTLFGSAGFTILDMDVYNRDSESFSEHNYVSRERERGRQISVRNHHPPPPASTTRDRYLDKQAGIHFNEACKNEHEPDNPFRESLNEGFEGMMAIEINRMQVDWICRHLGETEIVKKIRDTEGIEERLVVSVVDVLDYHSILEALKGCCALFCCLDSQEGYDDKMVNLEVRGEINVVEACA
ncbi:hypothetical protein Vadar_005089 [Vaccinium darrowii]|uniref:Uncharacterized protein n=1 Tax=Vaccinium darrowii TaxID=229202 RepID=A0ACB7YU51_9ERIC|nr:hypothetical protein Vadar_005089 [Vaccinium darrowii]